MNQFTGERFEPAPHERPHDLPQERPPAWVRSTSGSTSAPSRCGPCSSTPAVGSRPTSSALRRRPDHAGEPASARDALADPRPVLGAAGPRRLAGSAASRPGGAAADRRRPRSAVAGIGVDFTSCTMLPAQGDGTPLCAGAAAIGATRTLWPKLWKHHGAGAGRAAQPRSPASGRAVARPLRRASSGSSGSSPSCSR